jgi:hypothetical protein
MEQVTLGRRIPWVVMGGIIGCVFCPFIVAVVFGLFGFPGFTDLNMAIGNLAGLIGGGALGYFFSGNSVAARWSLGTAAALGSVSFLAGFVGPMILMPNANQGPLLGIFFTGPLGFIAGAFIGMLIGFMKRSSSNQS